MCLSKPEVSLQGIVELGMSSQDPLSPSALVDKLLKLLQALLSHGLLSQPLSQQHTWTAMLPGRQPSPLAILQVLSGACRRVLALPTCTIIDMVYSKEILNKHTGVSLHCRHAVS